MGHSYENDVKKILTVVGESANSVESNGNKSKYMLSHSTGRENSHKWNWYLTSEITAYRVRMSQLSCHAIIFDEMLWEEYVRLNEVHIDG